MMYLLIAAIILLYSFQTLFCVLYTKQYAGREELSSLIFCIIESVIITIVSLFFIGFRFTPSPLTWMIGLLNAFAVWGYNTFLIKASVKGSYAFMNVVLLFGGLLLPMFYNMFFLGGQIHLLQILAVLAMLASFVMINIQEINLKNTSGLYYLFCFILFICNGMYGTFLKMQSVLCKTESTQMIIITFAFMGILSLITLLVRNKKEAFSAFKMTYKAWVPLMLCLLSASLAINVLVFIIPMIDLTVLYTVENGGILLLSALYSFVFFKEKITALKLCGIALAAGSIVAMSI